MLQTRQMRLEDLQSLELTWKWVILHLLVVDFMQEANSNKCIASSNKCLTSSNKKLLVSYSIVFVFLFAWE